MSWTWSDHLRLPGYRRTGGQTTLMDEIRNRLDGGSSGSKPARKVHQGFSVLRTVGSRDLWVSECFITYGGMPNYSVSIMEFAHPYVVHETQYFADAFGAPEWRTALAEPVPGGNIARA